MASKDPNDGLYLYIPTTELMSQVLSRGCEPATLAVGIQPQGFGFQGLTQCKFLDLEAQPVGTWSLRPST